MDLRLIFKSDLCPVCNKSLIFSNDYSKIACQDYHCKFNKCIRQEINHYEWHYKLANDIVRKWSVWKQELTFLNR